jgi:hypothetical protein
MAASAAFVLFLIVWPLISTCVCYTWKISMRTYKQEHTNVLVTYVNPSSSILSWTHFTWQNRSVTWQCHQRCWSWTKQFSKPFRHPLQVRLYACNSSATAGSSLPKIEHLTSRFPAVSPMSPTLRFPRFPKRHHSAHITLNRYPETSFPRFPKLLHLCKNVSALVFQIGSSRARSLSHTHTRAHAHTHTRTHFSVTVSSRVLSYYPMGSRKNG